MSERLRPGLLQEFISRLRASPNIERQPISDEVMASVLAQLERVRELDRKRAYKDRRHPDEYIRDLSGVEETFNYIKRLRSSRLVVDVGAGYGEAIKVLGQKYGQGLEIHATNLIENDYLVLNLGSERVNITAAEFMEGFKPKSIAGIFAVASIAYSAVPELAISRLDQLLVPGGVIKASFRNPKDDHMKEYGFQTHYEFTENLRKLGYDVAVEADAIILAIKPGGPIRKGASELLALDTDSFKRSGLDKSWAVNMQNGGQINYSK